MKREFYTENVLKYIERMKNGEEPAVLATYGNLEITPNSKFEDFKKNIENFSDYCDDPSDVNYYVKSNIQVRLKCQGVDPRVRMVYEIILENFDSVLGVVLYQLFRVEDNTEFKIIERMLLIGF
ncbi:hypothetical protein CAEBREN_22034 [Caenorhabditis brenneri]|uniref:Uncharacterized protein n=1 Tax=Caenorhabditis brenneri TaxID=135651 RepID=G0MYH9_CAEBE|nr:hypothetical protein CAEBREN_22034 [Caenorhabditis brenneri]